MKYLILIYGEEKAWAGMPKAKVDEIMTAYMTYTRDLMTSGVHLSGFELQPVSSATTVRMRHGKVQTTDGPFAETKEQLGGFYLIDAKDLDEAIRWASRCPGALTGSIEVRPVIEH